MSEGQTTTAPGPEHEEKHQISQWLKKHGGDVWWEETNQWNYPTFQIKRNESIIQSKPDLVVKIDGVAIVAEFKTKKSKSNIYDSLLQLHGYWLSHFVHDQNYVYDGGQFDVEGFVTATGNSVTGHLFNSDDEDQLPAKRFGSGRKYAIDRGWLPGKEWNMTEQHVRQQWRLRKRALETQDADSAPCIGALLSTMLDGEIEPRPAVLWDTDRGENWRVLS